MTGLGAAIYAGFFGIAALWLFLTSDYRVRFSTHRAERSDPANVAADSDDSSPWLVSHSALK